MSISSTTRKAGPYTGNGITTSFPFAFKVFTTADVLVVRTDLSGIETTLALGVDYTVALNADQNASPGGSVNMLVAPPNGYLLTVGSQVSALQSLVLTMGGNFNPQSISDALDKLTILVQQAFEQLGRSVKAGISSSTTPDQLIPTLLTAVANALGYSNSASASATAAAGSATAAANSAASVGFTTSSVTTFTNKTLLASGPNTVEATSAPGSSAFSFRNRIINGNGWIDQANNNNAITINNTSNNFGPDRWSGYGAAAAGVFAFQGTKSQYYAGSKGRPSSIYAQTTTADAAPGAAVSYGIRYAIEGQDVADLEWGTANAKPITLSFLAISSKTGTFNVTLANGAGNRSYVATFTINQAGIWTPITLTVPGDTAGTWATDNTAGIKFFWNIGAGSNYVTANANTWQGALYQQTTGAQQVIGTLNAYLAITDVQFEQGTVATPFEERPIKIEMGLCQRYRCSTFQAGTAWAQNAGNNTGELVHVVSTAGVSQNQVGWRFPVKMRAAPTVTTYSPGAASANFYNRSQSLASGVPTVFNTTTEGCNLSNPQVAGDVVSNNCSIHASAVAEI